MENIVELKLSQLADYESIHHWLASKLQLPPYYGHNLDALWDSITELPLPITVLWHNDNDDMTDYSRFTDLFEEAAGEVEGFVFGYIEDEQ